MTQDERWNIRYQEVMAFIESYHRNPSKHRLEEHAMLNWVKQQRKLHNAEAARICPPGMGNGLWTIHYIKTGG